MYVDGAQVAKASGYTNSFPAAAGSNYLGRSQSGSEPFFNGRMDEVRFWSRALCPAEITHNKDCELYYPYIQNSLQTYLSFDQHAAGGINNGDTLAYDGSRNAENAVLHNFTLNGSGSNRVTGYLSNGGTCGYYTPAGLNDSTESVTQYVYGTTYFNACGEIAQLSPASGNPLLGNVAVKVIRYDTVPTYAGHAYVQRWYNVAPVVNPSTATANVILYFTQGEFDNYNAANGTDPDLPTGPNDASGLSHIRITQYQGVGSMPGAYTGSTVVIVPASAAYVGGRWAVAFPFTGAGGLSLSGNTGGAALPVKLVAFDARPEGRSVQLSWNVASQSGVTDYIIERSSNGQDFRDVAVVPTGGFTQYKASDATPAFGRNYYRLRITEKNGSWTHSAIQSVLFNAADGMVSVSPTPATTSVIIHFSTPSLKNTTADIQDLQGRLVRSVILRSDGEEISLEGLNPGVYLLHTVDGSVVKIIKQ